MLLLLVLSLALIAHAELRHWRIDMPVSEWPGNLTQFELRDCAWLCTAFTLPPRLQCNEQIAGGGRYIVLGYEASDSRGGHFVWRESNVAERHTFTRCFRDELGRRVTLEALGGDDE